MYTPREPIINRIRLRKVYIFEPNNANIVIERKKSMDYIWQQKKWPQFEYDLTKFQELLNQYCLETSYIAGSFDHLSSELQHDALIDFMVSEAAHTSSIEGEKIDVDDIRSSIRNHLGLTQSHKSVKDPRAEGIAQLMITVRKNYQQNLTKTELLSWHKMIFLGTGDQNDIYVGSFRTSPEAMQIISGPIGNEKVHYEALSSENVEAEMEQFIMWFNQSSHLSGPIRAAIAHLYFECIHPFDDGNGRIGRALVEKILSQEVNRPLALSLSSIIEKNKRVYYEELSRASKNGLTIDRWIEYFMGVINDALLESRKTIEFVVRKSQFWKRYSSKLNERQTKVIKAMFKPGIEGFKGGMNALKYMSITGCSKATATRDLQELLAWECFTPMGAGGRSTAYELLLSPHKKIL